MNIRPVTQSIVFRLIFIGVGLVVLGSSVRYYIMSSFLREDVTAVVAEQQTALANYVARDIGHQIFLRLSRLQQLAESLPAPLTDRPFVPEPAFGVSAPYEALFSAGLLLTTRDGEPLLDTTRFKWQEPIENFIRDSAKASADQETAQITRPIKVAGDGIAVLPITISLSLPGQPPWGFLTGFTYLYNPSFLGNLLQARLGQSGSGFLLISPADELFVAASNPEKVLTKTPSPVINLLHDRAMQGYRGAGITTNAHGVEEISAIVSIPNTNWFLVSAIATSEALGTVERVKTYLLRNTLLTVVLLIVILSVLITFMLRPLTNATRKADQMSRGQSPLEPLPGANAGEIGVLISAFNRLLTKLNEQQTELANAANHDSLTGLPNRRLLTDKLQKSLELARESRKSIALLFVDLDQFKPVNDSLGHDAGDQVLKMVAQRLSRNVRGSDCVARLGGDEFVILLTELDGQQPLPDVERIVSGLSEAITKPFDVAGTQCILGLSTGGIISNGNEKATDLMRWADTLMYKAKASGRGDSILKHASDMRAS